MEPRLEFPENLELIEMELSFEMSDRRLFSSTADTWRFDLLKTTASDSMNC